MQKMSADLIAWFILNSPEIISEKAKDEICIYATLS